MVAPTTATFDGNEFFSLGAKDIFIIKYSTIGDYQWGKSMGGYSDDLSGGICLDNLNNPIITGSYYSSLYTGSGNLISLGANDFFVAKFNDDGGFLWATNHGSTLDDYGKDVICDNSNNIFVLGEFNGVINFGALNLTSNGAKDVFIAKYNQFGAVQWVRKNGSAGDNDIAGSITTDIFGNAYACYSEDQLTDQGKIVKYSSLGANNLTIGFGGSGTISNKGIAIDNSGNIFVSGKYSDLTNFGDGAVNSVGISDYFIAKFNSSGVFGYKQIAGSTFTDCGNSICLDAQNNIIVGGYCNNAIYFGSTPYPAQGKEDAMIVKYDRYFSFGEIIVTSNGCNANNMSIDITVAGGVTPLNYNWSNGAHTEDITGISTGEYYITVTDAYNCFIETSVTVNAPIQPIINLPDNLLICPIDTVTLDAGPGFENYLWSTSETTQTIDVSQAGTFSVIVTDQNACTASDFTIVTRRDPIDLMGDRFDEVCEGEERYYSPLGFQDYLWSDGTDVNYYSTGEQGWHWVRVFDGTCHYYDSTFLNVNLNPIVDLGGDRSICIGDSLQIFVGAVFNSYLWQDNSTNDNFWAREEGLVSVNVTDSKGCEGGDAINIIIVDNPYVELGPDTSYCSNNPIMLLPNDEGADNTYLWNNGTTNNSLNVSNSGTYWVEVTNATGCLTRDSVYLQIFKAASIYLGEDIEYCQDSSASITALGDFETYLWSDGSTENSIIASGTQMFSVTVTDVNGCIAHDTIFTFEHIVLVPFLGLDTTLCNSQEFILQPENDYAKYMWSTGSSAPSITITQAGTYGITVTDDIGCVNSYSINIDYTAGPEITSIHSGGGTIIVNATGGTPPLIYSYDGDTWQQSNTFNFLPTDAYLMSVMDKNYCIATMPTFLDNSIQIPSFFTPNGDGYNDMWVIGGIYQYPSAEIQVYDRFGKKLFEFCGTDQGWNGTYMGSPLPSDTYWYAIRLMDGQRTITGNVTIKR
jgi:gliding motility-associated-like protein